MKIILPYLIFIFFASRALAQQQVVWVGDTVYSSDFGMRQFEPPNCPSGEWGPFSFTDTNKGNFLLSKGCLTFCCYCTPKTSGAHYDVIRATSTYNSGSKDSCAGKQWNIGPLIVSYLAISDSFMEIFINHPPEEQRGPDHYYEDNFHYDSSSRVYRSARKFTIAFVNNVDDSTEFSLTPAIQFNGKQFHFIFDSVGESPFLLDPLVRRRYRSGYVVSDTMAPFTTKTPGQFTTFARLQNHIADTLIEINGNFIFDTVKPLSVIQNANATLSIKLLIADTKLLLSFELLEPTSLTVSILDITGRTIERIVSDKTYQPGAQKIEYTPHSMSSGLYFLSYTKKDGTKVVPFIYLR